MEFGIFYSEIAAVMKQTGKNFFDVCCDMRKLGYKYVELALEELSNDKLLIFRENYMHISALYCTFDPAADNCGKIEQLSKMAYLADADFVIPVLKGNGGEVGLLKKIASGLAGKKSRLAVAPELYKNIAGEIPDCVCCPDIPADNGSLQDAAYIHVSDVSGSEKAFHNLLDTGYDRIVTVNIQGDDLEAALKEAIETLKKRCGQE